MAAGGTQRSGEAKARGARKARTKPARAKRQTMASQADKYLLYQRAVQEPDADLNFVTRVFKKRFGRAPRLLREDFCAAANTACHWVRRHRENVAWGVDLDPEPLAWGKKNNAERLLDPGQRERLHLIQGDVLEPREPKVEVVLAQNFSYFLFDTRPALRRYFEVARAGLQDEGLLVLDLYGGPDAQRMGEEVTDHGAFDYVWDQAHYDAITNRSVCHIHFRFPDKSELRRAFTYSWRLWTIPEVRELLEEAGFRVTEAYWEGTTPEGEGDGVYRLRTSAENEDAWLAYVVAVK